MKANRQFLQLIFLIILLFGTTVRAQTTAFTYQGRLTDGAAAANGSYDFQFSLFNAGGTQIGATAAISNIAVTNGIFTVALDFGANAFPGEERFLEIAVKKPVEASYTVLSPRQPVTSAPYAVKSLNSETAVNSAQLGGVAANQFVQTTDARLSDERNPTAGSGFYIQNTTSPQSSSNFSISGTGRAGILEAVAQFNLNGTRILDAAGTNTTVGLNSGTVSTGSSNSFFGSGAGEGNTTGSSNAFFGTSAGTSNTIGTANSFFGQGAGFSNTGTGLNSFFGYQAGFSNTAAGNSFFGYRSGYETTTGSSNSYFGVAAGTSNVSGSNNSFFGYQAGQDNLTSGSSFFGYQAGMSNTTGFRNSFFGEGAGRSTTNSSHNSFFGSLSGENNTGSRNSFFGSVAGKDTTGNDNAFFGHIAGLVNTTGARNSFFGSQSGNTNTTGTDNTFFGFESGTGVSTGIQNSFFGAGAGGGSNASFNSFFGFESGSSNSSGGGNSFFGTETGSANTSGASNSFFGRSAGIANTGGNTNTFVGVSSGGGNTTGNSNTFIGATAGLTNTTGVANTTLGANSNVGSGNLSFATAVGAGTIVSTSNTVVLGRHTGDDRVRIYGLGTGGFISLCRNGNFEVADCSSSLRYKTNVNFFSSGLNLVNRLQPITFDWKGGGLRDLGLAAEEVAAIEPLLATYGKDGQVEGVKYDRLGVILLNAVKEQQTQIEAQEKRNQELERQIERQQKQLEEQKTLIEGLLKSACAQNPAAAVCGPKEEK